MHPEALATLATEARTVPVLVTADIKAIAPLSLPLQGCLPQGTVHLNTSTRGHVNISLGSLHKSVDAEAFEKYSDTESDMSVRVDFSK
ncbi:unnamed protein product [Dibothriocephalus latus]|uniref:Uncharacterized protein n=1 Tax=Dibothriocephalus latus TaxID=60516 RepID=A0A3P6U207_DIBLA|nr:unnamed protein product [Dibothriocephalus latus]